MLDHHQGHGGSGDAPGAGGPWLAGVDGRRAGLADGAARVRLAGSRSLLLAPSLGHLRAASPTNVLGPLRSAPHARRRREGKGCRQPTANPLTLYRFRPSSPAAGGLSSGSRWCLHAPAAPVLHQHQLLQHDQYDEQQ